jgi:C-terminal processing protease CtpA/Prc
MTLQRFLNLFQAVQPGEEELEAGDLIMKVAQSKSEAVDVVGMRLDDVVKKIKGPKGSEVRLTVKSRWYY